ncbi:MAG: aminotransferase class I/II-fold pyridoxal phosphate-dependent enzyme [Candidatus Eiseniibacteriota bacterium]|jgi:histidinol-phosphate aminotransferase
MNVPPDRPPPSSPSTSRRTPSPRGPGTRRRSTGPRLSRRRFLGLTAGSAALGAIAPDHLLAGGAPAIAAGSAAPVAGTALRGDRTLLDDYVGRLCYNENPLGPSPLARDAIVAQAELAHRYSDWYAESLRADLAALHGVDASQVLAGCGATEVLRLAALALVDPAGNVVAPYPSYGQFAGDADFLGAEVRYAPLDLDHRIDLDAMASRVDGATAAVCITDPNNPTATVLPSTDVETFVADLPPGVAVVIDEAYHDYVHDPGHTSAMALVRGGQRVVVIRTFSKVHGLAGARVGYAVGETGLIDAMRAWQPFGMVSRLALEAARAALGDGQHVADTVALADQTKQYVFGALAGMGLATIPSETSFFMVDVGTSAEQVANELLARGIRVRTGWGMPQHLRISTGTMQEMQDLVTALRDILGLTGIARPAPAPAPVTALGANLPNPFRHTTALSFTLATAAAVRLELYDVRGRLVRVLADGWRDAGRHALAWDGTDVQGRAVPSGSYFCRLAAAGVNETRRLILVR